MVETFRLGVTKNWAPASMQARAVSGSSTVPAPSIMESPELVGGFFQGADGAGNGHGDFGRPDPAFIDGVDGFERRIGGLVRTTGTMPISVMKERISFCFILV